MDSLIFFFVRRPVTTAMLFLALFLWGIIALGRLPVSLMPPVQSPAISIVTRYPGIAPSKIEEILTKPLEEQIAGVGGIESIYSSSEEGESRINITFQNGMNVARRSLEVRARIDLIREGFPREVEEPEIIRYDPTDKPVFIVKIESDVFTLKEMREIAENKIKKRLERVDGLSEIRVGGGLQREINIDVDRGRLNFLGIRLSDLMSSLSQANTDLPAGKVFENGKWIAVQVPGQFSLVERINDVMVASPAQDRMVRVQDIARVNDGFKDIEDISRENGREIVSMYVHKAGDANTLSVCDGLAQELEAIQIKDLKLYVTYNQSQFIRSSLDQVKGAAVQGGLIATLLLFIFFRNARATLAIGISIPLSVIATFAVMHLFSLGLNVMSLSGLALGVGGVIDSSIVILDEIFLSREKRGFSPSVAAEAATVHAAPLVVCAMTSVAVFFPIVFASDDIKQLYGGFAASVTISTAISIAVSLYCLPALAARLYRKESHFAEAQLPRALAERIQRETSRLPDRARSALGQLRIDTLRRSYQTLLIRAFRNERTIAFALIGLMLSAVLLAFGLRQEYIDPLDSGEIRANVELDTGTHLDATNAIVFAIESELRKFPQVESVSSKVERWHADIYIKLKSGEERSEDAQEMIALFKGKTDGMEKAFVYYVQSGGEDDSRELDVEFVGNDSAKLREIAKQAASLSREVPGVQEAVLRFREGKQEMKLFFNHDKAALSGITAAEFGSTLRTGIQGSIPTKLVEDGKEVDIRVRFREPDRRELIQIPAYMIRGEQSSAAAGEISRIEEGESESKIYRKNKRKIATITVKLDDVDLGTAVDRLTVAFERLDLPEDYHYDFGGNYLKLRKNQLEMLFLIGLAVFLIYCILAAQFESFVYPAIILLCIPLSVCGVFWVLFVFRMSLNISVYIGIVMLAGLAVNNAIMLVDSFLRAMPARRQSLVQLYGVIVRCSRDRLRPILMTTSSTVLGFAPMIFDRGDGSHLWRPLAVTLLSGLIVSTGLALIAIPVLFARVRLWEGRRAR